jgi:hypothetical protein
VSIYLFLSWIQDSNFSAVDLRYSVRSLAEAAHWALALLRVLTATNDIDQAVHRYSGLALSLSPPPPLPAHAHAHSAAAGSDAGTVKTWASTRCGCPAA